MIIVMIHWRIKPQKKYIKRFLKKWKKEFVIDDRSKLIGEFLSEPVDPKNLSFNITWHLDPESLGNHKSFVNVGIWENEEAFQEQVGKNFNDDKPIASFEKYRRRRIVLNPKCWRMGDALLPVHDSGGIE